LVNSGGGWHEPANWVGGIPNGIRDTATFDRLVPSADAIIRLESPVTLGAIDFSNLGEIVLDGEQSLILAGVAGEPARIRLLELAFRLRLNTPLDLGGEMLRIETSNASQLRIDKSLLESSATISKHGGGTLTLAGDNDLWNGALELADGTVRVEHADALGTVSVGTRVDGGRLVFNQASSERYRGDT
jgi:hypothetical protein